MRRWVTLPILVLALLLGGLPLAVAHGDQANYLDRFTDGSYSGNDGSLHFPQPWFEGNDGPTDPASGAITVGFDSLCAHGRCLRMSPPNLAAVSVGRFADTSVFSEARVSYHVASALIESGGLLGGLLGDPLGLAQATLKVEVTKNGSSWTVLHQWGVADLLDHGRVKSHSIDSYLSRDFGIRFTVDGLLGGKVLIDDVEIVGKLAGSTTTSKPATTTTTTKPAATTTTTKPATTSTTKPPPASSTSTTAPGSVARPGTGDEPTVSEDTPTITGPVRSVPPPRSDEGSELAPGLPVDGGPPRSGNLRHTDHGLQAGYETGLFADTDMIRPQVLGLAVDYRVAVEVIRSSWLGLAGLLLLITAALLHGIDRRRRPTRG